VNLFSPGQVVATPASLRAIEDAGESIFAYLERHLSGDWGDINEEDRHANAYALEHNLRLLSAYRLKNEVRIYVITEWDHSVTTVLLPEEY
jgi:hypothetical protein